MRLLLAAVLAVTSAAATPADAQSVEVQAGNAVYHAADWTVRILTHTGRDSVAVLSPDGRWVAVVRHTGRTVPTTLAPQPATELWVVSTATGAGRRLVAPAAGRTPERTLAGLWDVVFSPDSRTVYFLSPAWATSSAVHAVEVATGRERYVTPGNSLAVVPRGRYRGYLIVQQHRYFLGGGSYDWTWLLTPGGHDVGPIGETEAGVEEFLETFAPAPARPLGGRDRR
jgi:hypothetical protein